jgi:hypothetical protein
MAGRKGAQKRAGARHFGNPVKIRKFAFIDPAGFGADVCCRG